MKHLATTLLVLAALGAAMPALALDLHARTPLATPRSASAPNAVNAVLGCDNNTAYNAFFQNTDSRYGNLFSFGSGSVLSAVGFYHFGYGFAGPYDYALEVWDPASCTIVVAKSLLSAGDAANALAYEFVDTCPDQFYLTGDLIVTIDPNSCITPSDCYPDLMFDNQTNVACPMSVETASTTPTCYDLSSVAGPFLLRIDVNNCATPARRSTWGQLKSSYR